MEDIKFIVNIVLLALVGVLALIGALKGLSRGIKRQTIRTVSIIISIALSFVAVKVLYNVALGIFDVSSMEDVFEKLEEFGISLGSDVEEALADFDPIIAEYILAIPLALVLGPVIFVLAFIVVSFLMLIVHAIVCGLLGFRKSENTKLTRLLGMVLGLVQGVAVAVVLLVPVIGLANTFTGVVETIRDSDNITDEEEELIDYYDEELADLVEHPVLNILGSFGGNLAYKSLATITVDGNSVDMVKQVDTVLVVYTNAMSIESDPAELTKDEQAAIKEIISVINESNYFSPLLSSIAKTATSMMEEELVSESDGVIKTVLLDAFDVLESSDADTLLEDIDTFCDFYFYFINEGVFVALEDSDLPGHENDLTDVLFAKKSNGKTTIDNAIAILDDNPRTRPIVKSLVKLTVVYAKESLMDSFDSTGLEEEEIEKLYDDVKGGVDEIVKMKPEDYNSTDEYKAAVADSIKDMVVDNGFITESEANSEDMDKVFAEVTEYITTEFEDKEEVSDAELIDVLLKYYNSYNGNTEIPLP